MANHSQEETNNGIGRKIIGIAFSVAILFIAWYGNYLPLAKSQAFIEALRSMSSVHSLQDFEDTLSKPLDIPSPIGQEELVRNAANNVVSVLQQTNDPKVIDGIMKYIEEKYAPVIARGRGMSFEQDLYLLGTMNELAFSKTRALQYLEAARKYYSEGQALGPKRPQFLYGMFDIYRTVGNIDGSVQIANQILSQWPSDERTKQALAQYLALVASSTKKTK